MTKPNIVKKHIATRYHSLSPELQEAVKTKYPLGFTDAMIRVDKPNGDFFYAVPYDTDEIAYMVKIYVKDDANSHDDDDKGYYDENGWYNFFDRKSNMIKSFCYYMSTTEIEGILEEHPDIKEAAVIGVPDPIRDQAVKAFVLPEDGATIGADEVIAYCEGNMAAFKVPSIVEIVEDFPRTCSMKIEKKLLK